MQLSLLGPIDRWFALAPATRQVDWLRGASFAHRGVHGGNVAENSRSAFAEALVRGHGIECDVQKSSDGEAVVFHDFELDRLTGESGKVSHRSASTLTTTALKGTTDAIQTLRQMLDQVSGAVPILIEVKSRKERPVAAICLAVRRALEGYRGPHAIMSFDPRVSRWFARHSPLTVRGLVVTEENDKALLGRLRRHLWLWIARPHFLAYDIRDLPSRFAAFQRKRGFPITTWTVRSAELRERASIHADAPIAEGAGLP